MSIAPADIADTQGMPDLLPLGLIGFRIETVAVGDAARLTVYFSKPLDAGTLWYKVDTDGWRDYSQNVVIDTGRRAVTIIVIDGGQGDADGVANGIIVDPSGPAILASPGGAPMSSGGGGGCFMGVLTNH